jgi:CRISPR-associated protein Cas1
MYERRFGTTVEPCTTLQQLRGLEGQRMKILYQSLAERHHLREFRRNYDPHQWDTSSPVNQALSAANTALSAANTALYGTMHSAILAMGCTRPGFVHSGKQHSFIYDIADLYKVLHGRSPHGSTAATTREHDHTDPQPPSHVVTPQQRPGSTTSHQQRSC